MTDHGTRACYQAGCRCLPCKLANAGYQVTWRERRRHNRPCLGQLVPATETWALLRRLLIEQFSQGQLARFLGQDASREIQLSHQRVTRRSAAKVQRLARRYLE